MAKRADGPKRAARSRDVALIFDRTEDREGFHVLRRRDEDHPVEVGTIRPLREGKPIDGEVVSLRPNADMPLLCDVKVELPDRRGTSDGPAQVASEDYRRGWDAIWGGGSKTRSSKPN
jgi:hypothetical protein